MHGLSQAWLVIACELILFFALFQICLVRANQKVVQHAEERFWKDFSCMHSTNTGIWTVSNAHVVM
jgi:hypothetical protein